MKAIRFTALSLVALMLFSILASISGLIPENENFENELIEEPTKMEATSPGHPVFAEYVGAYWCGPCKAASNNLHSLYGTNGGGGSQAEDFTYISFWESAATGWPADSPINRRAHINPRAYPTVVYGDATSSSSYHTNSNNAASFYESGGNMANSANSYSISVIQSQNGNMMDIDITATYTGSGSRTVFIYAAVTEETSPETYSGGSPNPHHVWKKWLLNSGGSGFESVTLSAGSPVTKSWSVPVSTVRAGGGTNAAGNFLTVAALLDGSHTSHRNVLSAGDSNMAPTIDLGIKSFTASNPSAPNGGYINGDVINVQATVINNGVDAYRDGGDLRFFYRANNVKTYVGSTQSLGNFGNTGATQSFTGQINTNNLPANAYQTTFGVELSNLVADKSGSNNQGIQIIPHDLIPIAKKAQVIGDNKIERGNNFLVEAKANINDAVDINTSFYDFELEISPSGQNQWVSGDMIVGGDQIFQEGTTNEHRQYLVKPTMSMGAGNYDIRVRTIDSRMQVSDWQVTQDAFELKNALPIIIAYPIPTVKVQTQTMVSVIGNIFDAETSLKDLVISSSSPNFIAWHPASEEIEVYFENIRYVNGMPTATGVEVTVYDGSDTGYGTLLFNVIENGQPRWAGVERQYVDEGGASSLHLLPYLSDTDASGNVIPAENLALAIVGNTNEDLLQVSINDYSLNFETLDDDVNGETTVTVRASDGEQYSDQQITISVNPLNDAPRLDLSELEGLRLKVGTQRVIFLNEIMTDVDGELDQIIVTASNEVPGAARVNLLDNTLTLTWQNSGIQTVTIQAEDRYDANIYTLTVEVYDSMPLLVGEGPDADVRLTTSNIYIGGIPEVNMVLNKDDVTIISLTSTWQMCNELTGLCLYNEMHDHDITMKSIGWTFDPLNGNVDSNGLQFKDYVKVSKVIAIAANGDKFESRDTNIKWTAEDYGPGLEEMSEEEVIELVEELDQMIKDKEELIRSLEEGSQEQSDAFTDLNELRSERENACQYTTCSEAKTETSSDADGSGIDLTVVAIVIGVIIIVLLAGLLFMRSGEKNQPTQIVDWANQLPANDAIANSMYGGAQEIFQQPVAAYAPVTQQVPPGAPPLPPEGLPPGWTMEQWAYYGHQYQR
mgnify:FL=1